MRFLIALLLLLSGNVFSQTIKIGELNSYKVFPAFLEPYKKGWELALEEINAAGGVNGRKLEVISRDDGGTPGDAVRGGVCDIDGAPTAWPTSPKPRSKSESGADRRRLTPGRAESVRW